MEWGAGATPLSAEFWLYNVAGFDFAESRNGRIENSVNLARTLFHHNKNYILPFAPCLYGAME